MQKWVSNSYVIVQTQTKELNGLKLSNSTERPPPDWIKSIYALQVKESLSFNGTLFDVTLVEDVLIWYDEPLLFIGAFEEGGAQHLVVLASRERTPQTSKDLWMFAPLSQEDVEGILGDKVELRSVFAANTEGWVFLAECDHKVEETTVMKINCRDVPESFLPDKGLRLSSGD